MSVPPEHKWKSVDIRPQSWAEIERRVKKRFAKNYGVAMGNRSQEAYLHNKTVSYACEYGLAWILDAFKLWHGESDPFADRDLGYCEVKSTHYKTGRFITQAWNLKPCAYHSTYLDVHTRTVYWRGWNWYHAFLPPYGWYYNQGLRGDQNEACYECRNLLPPDDFDRDWLEMEDQRAASILAKPQTHLFETEVWWPDIPHHPSPTEDAKATVSRDSEG